MARYIDADALKLDIDMSQGARITDLALSVIRAVQNAPTADVVPRAEAVREVFKAFGVLIPENTTLEEAVESYKKTQKIIRNMAIANAKAEVAREIFAEIYSYLTPFPNRCALISLDALAELKKKYTDATDTNVGHKPKGD